MFFPEAMTETEFIIPEKDLLPVTKVLAGQGIFHQVDASYMSSDDGSEVTVSWKERAATYATLERQLVSTMQALAVEEGKPSHAEDEAMIEIDAVRPLVEQIEGDAKSANGLLSTKQKNLEQLQNYIKQLEPIRDVDLDVSVLRNPRFIHSTLGSIPVANIERLETSLSRIPYVLLTLRKEQENAIIWLTGAQFNADILERAARSAYLNPLDLAETLEGTPSEIIKSLNVEIENTLKEIEKQKEKISQLHDAYQQQLQILLWRVRASRLLADAMAHFGRLHYTYLIVGWVPSSRLETLTQQLKRVSKNILIDATPFVQRGSINQTVPVSLRNPGLLGPFQQLVTTYARPRYEEIDPTLVITLTFPLLFGAMFGDVGHGLLLALFGGVLASRRIPALRSMSGLGSIVAVCGLVATVFGFLYGSIFGLEDVISALWIRPMENITQILGIAIGGGIVILSLGFLLNLFNASRAQDWGRFLFDPNGLVGLALFWSLLGLAAGAFIPNFPVPVIVFVVIAVIAGVAVMFSEALIHLVEGHRPLFEGGLGIYAIQAAVELFEKLISFLSNSLSYVRVGAFAVAHVGLSAVIYILANLASPGHGIAYWLVAIIGNLFIVGFEGLIVGIQTMRLEYYEFFSKFFTGGGAPYEPLAPLPVGEE
jgi:V/A-type H+-transporting ATPase subunit I